MLVSLNFKRSGCIRFNRKYRGYLEIVALILEVAKGEYATRFSIAKYTKTNYTQLNKYLQVLVKMHFIEVYVVNGRVFYKTSVEGNNFLKHYSLLLNSISHMQEINEDADIAKVQFTRKTTPQKLNFRR